uniref:EF-hand domain-containing protein n=1 Tax=Anguilla anguilla TaxID=7936 RepID=A0A0E9SQ33_ANGAN
MQLLKKVFKNLPVSMTGKLSFKDFFHGWSFVRVM